MMLIINTHSNPKPWTLNPKPSILYQVVIPPEMKEPYYDEQCYYYGYLLWALLVLNIADARHSIVIISSIVTISIIISIISIIYCRCTTQYFAIVLVLFVFLLVLLVL